MQGFAARGSGSWPIPESRLEREAAPKALEQNLRRDPLGFQLWKRDALRALFEPGPRIRRDEGGMKNWNSGVCWSHPALDLPLERRCAFEIPGSDDEIVAAF